MTDPTPNAPMPTPLSPAAQAVLDAALFEVNAECHAPWIAAAVLRVAADQVVPEQLAEPRGTGFRWGGWAAKQWVRNRLLAIATELESQ